MSNSAVKDALLQKYNANERGIWIIYGEDSNCDLGGSHHSPKLATVTGTYKNVVEYALTLPSFFTWGGGGDIKKFEQPSNLLDVDKFYDPEVTKLKSEKEKLLKSLDDINKKIIDKTLGKNL